MAVRQHYASHIERQSHFLDLLRGLDPFGVIVEHEQRFVLYVYLCKPFGKLAELTGPGEGMAFAYIDEVKIQLRKALGHV